MALDLDLLNLWIVFENLSDFFEEAIGFALNGGLVDVEEDLIIDLDLFLCHDDAADQAVNFSKIPALMSAAVDFSIPVYKNMPAAACLKPAGDGSPNNKLGGLGVAGFALTPTFQRDILQYDLIVDASVADIIVEAAALDSSATIAGAGPVNLQSGINTIPVNVTAGNGTVRTYVINVVRRADGSLVLTFNRPTLNESFTFQDFCREAAEELLAVAGLIEE